MYARGLLTACYLFNEDFARIVDLQVIKLRTNVPSETTQTRDDFRHRLLRRDARCVWTGIEPDYGGVGLHIIPYKQGPEVRSIIFCWEYVSSSPFLRLLSQWFRLIIANRPKYGESVGTLNDINDIRNGIFASPSIHSPFDQRFAVVLKVCHISPPALVLPDLCIATNPLRLQTLFLKEKTFLHATTEPLRQTSRIRTIAVTRYNG